MWDGQGGCNQDNDGGVMIRTMMMKAPCGPDKSGGWYVLSG